MKKIGLKAVFLGIVFVALNANAAQPHEQIKQQVAGFYRVMVGDFEVTALSDGYTKLTTDKLKGMEIPEIEKILTKNFMNYKDGVRTAVNTYLVNTKEHLILVDAGGGECMLTAGNTITNIEKSGYKATDVDVILMTHLHADHFCGLSNNSKANYPNATIYLSKDEADFWLHKDISKLTESEQTRFLKARSSLAPYIDKQKMNTFISLEKINGVTSFPTKGHTPGHTSYMFTSNEDTIVISGDVVHSYAIQFDNPKVALSFDSDNKEAIATREKFFDLAAKSRYIVAGTHIPFPGIGHIGINNDGKHYWVPIQFSPVMIHD